MPNRGHQACRRHKLPLGVERQDEAARKAAMSGHFAQRIVTRMGEDRFLASGGA